MTPYYSDDLVTLYHGEALSVISQLPTNMRPPVHQSQIIHELTLIAAKFHEWGNGADAFANMPEWMRARYRWALVQARDSGAVGS